MEEEKLLEEQVDSIDIVNTGEIIVPVVDETTSLFTQDEMTVAHVKEVETIDITISENVGPHAYKIVSDHGKGLGNQHLVSDVEGLASRLKKLERFDNIIDVVHHPEEIPEPLEAVETNQANYYLWDDGNPRGENRIGYFVFIHQQDDVNKIGICDSSEREFGVTVTTAGFIGNQSAETFRGNNYGLVVHSGLVAVRCELEVNRGDYVVPNNSGYAKKADCENGEYGYLVRSLSDINGDKYAIIALTTNSNQSKQTFENIQDLQGRMDKAEYNITSVGNVANEASRKAQEALNKVEYNNAQVGDQIGGLIDKVDSTVGKVEDLETSVGQAQDTANRAEGTASSLGNQALNIANNALTKANDALTEAQSAKDEIYIIRDEANNQIEEASSKAQKAQEEISALAKDMEPLSKWTDGTNTGISGFVAKSNEESTQLGLISQWKTDMEDGTNAESIAAIRTQANANEAKIDNLTSYLDKSYERLKEPWSADGKDERVIYYDETNEIYYYYNTSAEPPSWQETADAKEAGIFESIAHVEQKANDNEAAISNLTEISGRKYTIVECSWQDFLAQEHEEGWKNKIYRVEEDKYDTDRSEGPINLEIFDFTQADPNIEYYSEFKNENGDTITTYYWCDSRGKWYPSSTRQSKYTYYYYKDGKWESTTDPSVAGIMESVALVQQQVDVYKTQLDWIAIYEDDNANTMAAITERADEHEGRISSLTSYIDKTSYIELKDGWPDNESKVDEKKIYFSDTYITVEQWEEPVNPSMTVYFADDANQYHYYDYENEIWVQQDVPPSFYYYFTNKGWKRSKDPADAGIITSIANVTQKANKNEAAIESLISHDGYNGFSLAQIKQAADDAGAKIEGVVSNLNKYSVGEYSQAYGLSFNEAKTILKFGIVFIPTSELKESYAEYIVAEDGDTSTIYHTQEFSKGFYYTWNGTNWVESGSDAVSFLSEYVVGSDNMPYWVVGDAYASEPNYKVGVLYKWELDAENKGFWKEVMTCESNALARSTSLIQQKANEITLSVTSVSNSVAALQQKVDTNEASISMIVTSEADGGKKINSASIITSVNEDESGVTINADKINIDGLVSFTNGANLKEWAQSTISRVEVQYESSDSETDAPTEGWSTTAPAWEENKYMWQRTVTYYEGSDKKPSISGPTCIQGAKGATGKDGTGVAIKGSAYAEVAVSDDIIGSEHKLYSNKDCSDPIVGASDGDAYLVDGYLFVYSGSNDKFICTGKIQGPKGETGSSASLVNITPSALYFKSTTGKDGVFTPEYIDLYPRFQAVTYQKWQYSVDGGINWNDVKSETNGLTIGEYNLIPNSLRINRASTLYTDTITSISFRCLSSNDAIYDVVSIAKIYDVVDLEIEGRNLLLDSGTPVTNANYPIKKYNLVTKPIVGEQYTITIKATLGGEKYYFGAYNSGGTVFLTHVEEEVKSSGIYRATFKWKNSSSDGNHVASDTQVNIYPMPRSETEESTIEWIKLEKGDKATDWTPALEESSANVNVMLSNEAHFFEADSSGVPTPTSITLDVIGYMGSIQCETTVGTITGLPSAGMTATISQNATTNTKITITVTEELTSVDYGTLTIPVTVNGHTINKVFSWVKAKDGETGPQGDAGTSITKVVPQYYLSSSNTECKDGEWQYDEPKWTSGKYIWTRSEITWDTLDENGQNVITYTDSVLAGALNSANENASDANTKAEAALGTAEGVETTIGQWCYMNNKTFIDGGKIYTGSVTADQLAANILQSEGYTPPTTNSIFSQKGTFFNLADGSITSQSFAIDADGNTTIAGRITATSGFIGDENGNGFEIKSHTGNTKYYLGNNQNTYEGSASSGTAGVYIGPDGIGLGNGNFYVTNEGDMVANGNIILGGSITWHSSNNPVKVLYSASSGTPTKTDWENATDDDNTTTTKWHTTWNEDNDKYAAYSYDGGNNWDPAIKIKGEDGDSVNTGLNEVDVFNMLTNNGEKQGIFPWYATDIDPETGETMEKEQVYINAERIKVGVLSGITVKSTDNQNNIVEMSDGFIYLKPYDEENQNNNTIPKMMIGFNNYWDTPEPYILFGRGTDEPKFVGGYPVTPGIGLIYKDKQSFSITYTASSNNTQGIYFYDEDADVDMPEAHISFGSSKVDFTYATVTGLKITFG